MTIHHCCFALLLLAALWERCPGGEIDAEMEKALFKVEASRPRLVRINMDLSRLDALRVAKALSESEDRKVRIEVIMFMVQFAGTQDADAACQFLGQRYDKEPENSIKAEIIGSMFRINRGYPELAALLEKAIRSDDQQLRLMAERTAELRRRPLRPEK